MPGEAPSLPTTPAELLDRCNQIRKKLVGDAARRTRGARVDTLKEFTSFLRSGDACLLPSVEPLWTAMYRMNRGEVPPFPGEPQTIPHTFEALELVSAWCREIGPPPAKGQRRCYERDHCWLNWYEDKSTDTFHSPARSRQRERTKWRSGDLAARGRQGKAARP
jgi:hypothetical protein